MLPKDPTRSVALSEAKGLVESMIEILRLSPQDDGWRRRILRLLAQNDKSDNTMVFSNFKAESVFEVSWASILRLLLGVFLAYVVYLVRDIIIWFVFALIISVLFNYVIDLLQKKRIPRLLSAVVLYLGFCFLFGFFLYQTAPLLLDEIQDFIKQFPQYVKKIAPILKQFGVSIDLRAASKPDAFVQTIEAALTKASGSVGNALFVLFGGVASTLLVFTMAFFMSVEGKIVERFIVTFSSAGKNEALLKLWLRAKKKISAWFITRIIGVVFVWLSCYLVLALLNVKYAFILSTVAGVFDLVPIVGPAIACIAIMSVTYLNSPMQALIVGIIFIVIQQLENHVLFPFLFKKLAGLSPVLVLVSLAIGAELWGVAGAILAIPLAGVVYEVIKEYLIKVKHRQTLSDERAIESSTS